VKKFYLHYKEVPENPSLKFAVDIVNKVREYDEIISEGGGSTIDVGKYISYILDIPHTAIPTTAGTGSEVTKYAVFIHNKKKMSLEDDKFIPDNYILDPSKVVSLPPKQTASSGLDALSQAIESYWSPKSTFKSRWYAKKAIGLIMNSLWNSYNYPLSEVFRFNMLKAANYSGRAINITKTGVCHAVSYPLTIHYGIPHGIACIMTLPQMILFNDFRLISASKIERLIKSLDIDVYSIRKKIDKNLIIKEVFDSDRVQNNPIRITEEDLKIIL